MFVGFYVLLTRFCNHHLFLHTAGEQYGLKGGWSVTLLLSLHPDVAPGQPVDVRLATMLEMCYGDDVTLMVLALDGIRSRNRLKANVAASKAADARTEGTFQSLCCVLCACWTNLIHHFPHSWCSIWDDSVRGVSYVGCA